MLFSGIPNLTMFLARSQIAKYPNIWLIWLFGYLAACKKNMVKWGIPEKSIKNVAQRRWPYVRRSLQSKVMARNQFLEIPPAISPATLKMVTNMGRSWATEITKSVLKPVKQWEQLGNMHNWKFRNFLNKNPPIRIGQQCNVTEQMNDSIYEKKTK